jgi:hypothetical protein
MSNAKHAPWTVEVDDLSGSLLVIGSDNHTVAEVFDRKRADIANLIASAPDLLEALRRSDLMLEEICNAVGLDFDDTRIDVTANGDSVASVSVSDALESNKAAIAKAKGETQ